MSGDLYHAARLIDAIWSALQATYEELVTATGLQHHTVKYRAGTMRRDGLCHVGGWKRTQGKGGKFSPIFVRGAGEDVRCKLRPLTDEQCQKRYRLNLKKTGGDELRRAKGRARAWEIKAKKQGDPMVNALFGRTA